MKKHPHPTAKVIHQAFRKLLKIKLLRRLLRYARTHKSIALIMFIVGVMKDILFMKDKSDVLVFGLLGVYILIIYIYKFPSKITFIGALILLIFMYGEFLMHGPSRVAEEAATWVYLFLVIGLLQK